MSMKHTKLEEDDYGDEQMMTKIMVQTEKKSQHK